MAGFLASLARSVTSPTSSHNVTSLWSRTPTPGDHQGLPANVNPIEVIINTSTATVTPDRMDVLIESLRLVPDMLDSATVTIEKLTSAMVKHTASHNVHVKAMAYQFIIRAAEEPGQRGKPFWEESDPTLGLAILNALHRDLEDPNPEVRALAVSTISQLKVLASDYAMNAIQKSLQDSNPEVRRSAVTACGKLYLHSPEVTTEAGAADLLYSQIRDSDPTVVTFAMQTVNIMLKGEGGIVIPNSMAKYFLKHLEKFPNFELCFVLDNLRDYYCRKDTASDEVRMMIINAMDPYLDSRELHIFLSAASLFLEAARNLRGEEAATSALIGDFAARVLPQVIRFIKPSSKPRYHESQVQVLKFFVQVDSRYWTQESIDSAKEESEENKGAVPKGRSIVGRGKNNSIGTLLDYLVVRRHDSGPLRHTKLLAAFHLSQGAVSPFMAKNMFTYLMELLRSEEGESYGADLVRYVFSLADQWPEHRRELFDMLGNMLKGEGATAKRFSLVALQCIKALGHRVEEMDEVEAGRFVTVADRSLTIAITTMILERQDEYTVRLALSCIRTHTSRLPRTPAHLEAITDRVDPRAVPNQALLFAAVVVFAHNPPATQRTLAKICLRCAESPAEHDRRTAEMYCKSLQDQNFVDTVAGVKR